MHAIYVTLLYIFVLRISLSFVAGQIFWDLQEKPVVFGKDVHLVCSIPNDIPCCRKYNRKWNVGRTHTLTIMNGKSVNETKYYEELNETSQQSILTIKSFSVHDVNIPYECVYGFMQYCTTLLLKEDEYEFHPKEQLLVEPKINRRNIFLVKTLEIVYPKPYCTAMIGDKDISSELNVTSTSHNLLYSSIIQLNYMMSQKDCSQRVIVNCLVGKTNLLVADFIPCRNNDNVVLWIFIIGIFCIGIGIVIIVISRLSTRQTRYAINTSDMFEEN